MSYATYPPFVIKLDSPRPSWTSGDHITGKVVLNSPKDESVGGITITLFGRAKAKIIVRNGNNRRVIRSRATLISEAMVLYSSHFTLRKDVYEWPFEFVMPAETSRIAGEAWEQDGPYNHQVGQPLPPTMGFVGEGLFGARLFECFTEYKLTAKLDRPTRDQSIFSFDSGYETEALLYYEQSKMLSAIDPTPVNYSAVFDIRSLLLDPSHSTKLTFKEKMKSTFNSSSLPSSVFRMTLTIPTKVNLGGRLKISACLRHETEKSTAPMIPDITAQVSLTITKQVSVRADRVFLTDHAKASSKVVFSSTFPSCQLNKGTAYSQDFVLDSFEARDCAPTFGTYNIAQDYVLEVTCNIQCVDKKEKMVRGTRFTIYPRLEGALSSNAGPAYEPVHELESLPSYAEAAEASSSRSVGESSQASSRGVVESSPTSPIYELTEGNEKR